MDDIIAGGKDDRGLPSFVYPLKALIKKGHTVKIILISSYRQPINVKVDWLKNEDILYNSNADNISGNKITRIVNKTKESLRLCKVISRELKNGKYDFVYCHGKAAVLGNIVSNVFHVPCGYRIYGTYDMYHMLETKGLFLTICKYPGYWLLYNLKKKFMLITDDGSHGDYVVKHMRLRNNYEIFEWKNGVDRLKDIEQDDIAETQKCPYIFTAGRVTEPKATQKSIEVINSLVAHGYDIDLLIAGPLNDTKYYNKMKDMISALNIETRVKFLGDLPRETMLKYAHNAKSVLLFANQSNLSNVFIECGMIGSVIITFDEQPLHEFIIDNKSGFFVKKHLDAEKIIVNLLKTEEQEIEEIKKAIKAKVNNSFMNWDERCQIEVELIERYENRKRAKVF